MKNCISSICCSIDCAFEKTEEAMRGFGKECKLMHVKIRRM